jgi:hypothetical protein
MTVATSLPAGRRHPPRPAAVAAGHGMAVTSSTRRSAGTGAGSSPLTGSSARSPPSHLARSFDHAPPCLPHRSSPASAAPSTDAGEEPAGQPDRRNRSRPRPAGRSAPSSHSHSSSARSPGYSSRAFPSIAAASLTTASRSVPELLPARVLVRRARSTRRNPGCKQRRRIFGVGHRRSVSRSVRSASRRLPRRRRS